MAVAANPMACILWTISLIVLIEKSAPKKVFIKSVLNVMTSERIENLSFSGGGIKALAFCGALRALEKEGLMGGVKRIIGTSAGALVGMMLACGFTSYDLIDIIKSRDFKHLKDNSSLLDNVHRFVFNYGFYSGDLIETWLGEHLEARGISSEITFDEIWSKFGKELIITGTHLNERKIVYFCRDLYPNMPVKTAVRISTSIPLFFEPIRLDKDIYVDGALLGNNPIGYFEKIDPGLERTIGFNVASMNEIKERREIYDVFHVIDLVMNTLITKADMLTMTELQQRRTIVINTKEVNTTDFHIRDHVKEKLFGRGYRCTKKFLSQRNCFALKKSQSDNENEC